MFLLGKEICYEVERRLYGYTPHCYFYTFRVEREGEIRMYSNVLFQDIVTN